MDVGDVDALVVGGFDGLYDVGNAEEPTDGGDIVGGVDGLDDVCDVNDIILAVVSSNKGGAKGHTMGKRVGLDDRDAVGRHWDEARSLD